MGEKKTLFETISRLFGNSETKPQENKVIAPKLATECKSEKEFIQRMMLLIGGPHVKLAIIQQPDLHTPEEIESERQSVEAVGGTLKVPSIIMPVGSAKLEATPYIVVFTHDNKLFVHPYDTDAFSDIVEEEKE